jgi:hypothetical protein
LFLDAFFPSAFSNPIDDDPSKDSPGMGNGLNVEDMIRGVDPALVHG